MQDKTELALHDWDYNLPCWCKLSGEIVWTAEEKATKSKTNKMLLFIVANGITWFLRSALGMSFHSVCQGTFIQVFCLVKYTALAIYF